MTKLEQFIDTLKNLLTAKSDKKSVQEKLENPEELAKKIANEIGSDTQRIKL